MEAQPRDRHRTLCGPRAAPPQEITQKGTRGVPSCLCDPGKEAYAFSMLMSLYSLSPISLAKLRTVPSS